MSAITFGSVCSGIEAASVAWHPLGWRAAWLSEIEPNPSAMLAHHYPEVPNLGDMNRIPQLLRNGEITAPDVFCGGTPCQAFSVAGLRNSLDDARGNLSLKFCDIANEIDIQRGAAGLLPAVIFWENVPGVLSTKDNAFGCFLGQLAGEDCPLEPPGGKWSNAGAVLGPQRAIAWRILDAQYFGVAQRRKRVFVVASARDGFDPAAVLLEREGVRRDSAPSRGQGQDVTGTLSSRTSGGGGLGTDFDCAGGIQPVTCYGGGGTGGSIDVAACLVAKGQKCDFEVETFAVQLAPAPIAFDCKASGLSGFGVGEIASTMRAMGHASSHSNGGGHLAVSYAIQAGALRTNPASGPDGAGVQPHIAYTLEARAEVQAVAMTLEATAGRSRGAGTPISPLAPVCVTGDITRTLKAEGFDASEDGTGRGQPIVNVPTGCDGTVDGPVPPLMARSSRGGAQTLSPGHQTDGHMIGVGMAVRRLTPRECERLQGFPDDYTFVPVRGKPAADGPRYKALGNSWAVPVVRWIGRRIDAALGAQLQEAA